MNGWRTLLAVRLFAAVSESRLVSFVGLLSVGGLVVAVAVLVTVLSVMNGFQRELEERVLSILPHGYLHAELDDPRSLASLVDAVRAHPQVKAVAPALEAGGFLVKGASLHEVAIKGVDPARETAVSRLPDYMTAGSWAALAEPFTLLLGAPLAEALGLAVGDRVVLALPELRFGLAGPALTSKRMTVGGVFETGADLDDKLLLVSLADGLKLKRQTRARSLVVRTADLQAAPRVIRGLGRLHRLAAEAWDLRHGGLYEAIQTQKATILLLLLTLVAVAAFNVVANLVMTVDESRGRIAILRTLGASPGEIRAIFLLHGLLVGVAGLLLGLTAGLGLAYGLAESFAAITGFLGVSPMDEYFVRYLPVEVRVADLLLIGGISLAVCAGAAVYPAGRAARVQPAPALAREA